MGKYFLSLHLFDAAPAPGPAPAPAAATVDGTTDTSTDGKGADAETEVIYGKPAEDEPQEGAPRQKGTDFEAEFERLIKGDYKSAYEKRMQNALKDRFKNANATEKQFKEAQKVLDTVALRYGKEPSDVNGLLAALDGDTAHLTQRALENGVTEDQQKMIDQGIRAQAELARLQKQQRVQNDLNAWMQESETLKATYPNLDVLAEINHPETGEDFLYDLQRGKSVAEAYRRAPVDEITSGLMQHTAQKATEKVISDIKARGMRPPENGSGSAAPAKLYKSDPSQWDDKDIERVRKAAMEGQRIRL